MLLLRFIAQKKNGKIFSHVRVTKEMGDMGDGATVCYVCTEMDIICDHVESTLSIHNIIHLYHRLGITIVILKGNKYHCLEIGDRIAHDVIFIYF